MIRDLLKYSLLLFFSYGSFGQGSKLDSLKNVVNSSKEDTVKLIALNLVTRQILNSGHYKEALTYADQARSLGEKLLRVAKKNEIYSVKRATARSYNNTGLVYFYEGYYPDALKYYFASLKIREEIGDKEAIAASCNNIGSVYNNQGNTEEALKMHQRSLAIKKEIHDLLGSAISYVNIGALYETRNNWTLALENYETARKIYTELGNIQGVSMCDNNRGEIYEEQGNLTAALEKYSAALEVKKQLNDPEGLAAARLSLGSIYIKLAKKTGKKDLLNKAKQNLEEGLVISREVDLKEAIKESYNGLCTLYLELNDHKSALANYKLYILYRDSMQNEENTKKTVQAQMQYEFDKKEAATKLEQEKKDALAEAEKRKQNIILLSISGFGLLVLVFAIFAYRSFLQKKRANIEISMQKGIIEEKQKEILDSIYYARRIQRSLLTHPQYIQKNLKRLMKG